MRKLLPGLIFTIATLLFTQLFTLANSPAYSAVGKVSAIIYNTPALDAVTTALTMSTTYGEVSTSRSFKISGADLSAGILVSPPAGFEVSTDNVNFQNSLTVGGAGNVLLTPVYVRIKQTTNAGNYSGNIIMSSPGANDVMVPIVNSTVQRVVMNVYGYINKIYGDNFGDITLYYNTPGFTFTNPGLRNDDEFYSLHFAFSAGNNATAAAGTYTNTVTVSDFQGRNGFLLSNYDITYQKGDFKVLPAPLTITTTDVDKPYGSTLTNVPKSTNFTSMGLKNGETIGTVNITYGVGADPVDAPGLHEYQVIISAASGGTFNPTNYDINYEYANIKVGEATPNLTSEMPNAVITIYSTASDAAKFNVTGTNLTAPVLITPPPGFDVSTDNINFSSSVTVGSAGTFAATPVYIRLSSTLDAGFYSGNIRLVSGVLNLDVAMLKSTVNPAPLTIAGADQSKTYGAVLANYTGLARHTVTAGGLKNGETITGVTTVYGTGAEAGAKVGIYTASARPGSVTGGNGFKLTNYDIAYKVANIKVLPAALLITANPASKTYGDLLSVATGSAAFTTTGLQNGESVGGVTLSYGTGAARSDVPGVYNGAAMPSAASGGTFLAANYLISYAPANLEVTPAPLTITADNQSREVATNDPEFTVTYSGFVNNDTQASLTSQPIVTSTAFITSPVGHYPITPAGASSPNYTITYVNGTLTIVPKPGEPVVIYNTFTPNGDGTHDKWEIPALLSYPKCVVNIYNRYGQAVYTSIGYTIPWDGTYKGGKAPMGVFYYVVNLNNGTKPIAGNVTVLR